MASSIAAAVILFGNPIAKAERSSPDEVAIRLGVTAWFNERAALNDPPDLSSLKALFRPELEAIESVNGTSRTAHGLSEYVTLWQPFVASVSSLSATSTGDLKLAIDGDHAQTTFTFVPQGTYHDGRPVTCEARVTLTWKKHDGLWQIAREEVRSLPPNLDPTQTTTQR